MTTSKEFFPAHEIVIPERQPAPKYTAPNTKFEGSTENRMKFIAHAIPPRDSVPPRILRVSAPFEGGQKDNEVQQVYCFEQC